MVTVAKTIQPVRMPRFGHRVDKTDPILRGCVGWWPLNDGAGTKAKDVSGGGHDGTYFGSPTFVSSTIGDAVSFPGTVGTILTCPQASDLGLTRNCTVSCWVKPDSVGSYKKLAMMGDPSGTSFYGFYLSLGTSSFPVYFGIKNTSNTSVIASAPANDFLSTTEWSNITGTYDGVNVKIYVNGVEVGSASQSGDLNDTNRDILIGAGSLTTEPLNGDMQNTRIYDRALSASEVSRLYQDPWAGLEPLSPFSFFSVPAAGAPLAVFYNHYKNQGII